MDHWRAFFAQADSDLWTIIDQAILLAANDFPAEFKHKRCEIAETLFAKRTWPPDRSIEATMLSGSMVTNATANGSHHTCRQDTNTPKHAHTSEVEGKVSDSYSLGSDSKASAVDRHGLGRSAELNVRPGCHNQFNADRHAQDCNAVDMDHTVQHNVSMIKEKIMDASNQSEDQILQSLQALEHLEINVEILKETDIGREVNKFRKHSSGPVRILAKQLVRTWKDMVDEWVKSVEGGLPLNASAIQGVSKLDGTVPKFQGNPSSNSIKTSMQMPKSPWQHQYLPQPGVGAASFGRSQPGGQGGALPNRDDDFSLPGRKLYGEHVREEMGSSRVESDELDRPGTMEKRTEMSGYRAESTGCMVAKGSIGGSGPGRPEATIPALKRSFVNNDVASERRKDVAEKFRRTQNSQGDLSQNNVHGKFLVGHGSNQNVSATDHMQSAERHEIPKRRLSNESQYADTAKKLRDMQPSGRAELSKWVHAGAKVPVAAKSQHYANKW